MTAPSGTALTAALLADTFRRVHEVLSEALDGLSPDDLTWQPQPDANPAGWLAWHLTRVQDDHMADIVGREQAWTAQGFADRFALPYAVHEHGYGHDSEQVAAFAGTAHDLIDYHHAVTELTCEVLDGLDTEDYARVVDESWDPPVTAAVRVVSVVNEVNQHVGQIAYVRGLIERM